MQDDIRHIDKIFIAVEPKVIFSLFRYRPYAIHAAAHGDQPTTEPHHRPIVDQWLLVRVEAGRVNAQDLIVDTSRRRHLARGLNELPAATIDNEVAPLACGNRLSNECIHFCHALKVIRSV